MSEHFSLLPLSTPISLDWLADRLAERPLEAPTTKTVWSVAAAPARWRGLLEMASTALRVTFGLRLTPESEPLIGEVTELAA